jgi:hypothetical protein
MTIYYNCEKQTKDFIDSLSSLLKENDFHIDFSTGYLYYNSSYIGAIEDDGITLNLIDDDPYDGVKELYSVTHE